MKRIAALVALAVVVLAGVAAVINALFQPIEVIVATAQSGMAMETVYATGHVEARHRRTLRAQRAAVLAEIFQSPRTDMPFSEGDVVYKGEPILRLRDSAIGARRSGSQAELTRLTEQRETGSAFRRSYELRIGEADDTAKDARAREQRLMQQLETGGISRDAYDQAKTRADVAEQQLNQLKQEYSQAIENLEAALTRAQAELDTVAAQELDDTLTAPIDGVILKLPLEPGEFAAAGTELVKVGDLRDMILEAEVNEDDIGRVTITSKVHVRLAGYENTLIEGRVFEVLPDADRSTKGYTVKVVFNNATLVPDTAQPLKSQVRLKDGARPLSGMTAELGIVIAEKDGALVIPRPALTPDYNVFVIDESGRAKLTKVTVGLVNFNNCEVTSGLKPGDLVVISNLKELSDGARVSVKK